MTDRLMTPIVDSAEGIRMLLDWARSHGMVLNEAHERIAERYGVPTGGVVFSRQIAVPGQIVK